MRFLDDRGQAEAPAPPLALSVPDDERSLVADDLLADLLGATLVDAQDELRVAWTRLETSGHPARAERWMVEPPPWPPASVALLTARGPEGLALLETLLAQVAPDIESRDWLRRSWLDRSRHVEGKLLDDLAGAAGGRLAGSPTFRAWLRGVDHLGPSALSTCHPTDGTR